MAKKLKAAAGKTPFHTVVEKVQRGTITDKEISDYFVAQPNPQKPFDFTVGLIARPSISRASKSPASWQTHWRTMLRSGATDRYARRPHPRGFSAGLPSLPKATHGFDCHASSCRRR
jgi:hypothetical protein